MDIDFIIKNYKDTVEEIHKEAEEPKDMQLKLERLERMLVSNIKRVSDKLQDSDKLELIKLMKEEINIVEIVATLKDDEEKIKYLPRITEKFLKDEIVFSFDKDENKIKYVEECERKGEVLVTIRNIELLSQFLENNEKIKNEVAKFLYNNMKYGAKENLWEFMKLVGLENQVIPHILADSKYEILESMNEDMKRDVERYLGKPIPQNIEEISMYEKVGIDLDAIQESVVVDKEQLNIDELQKKFLEKCKPDENNKKRVSLKDFIGTVSPNLKYGLEKEDIKTWEDLLKGLKRMEHNIEEHSEEYLFNGDNGYEPIRLEGIHGKYFVHTNGNHRMTMLKLRYLTEISRANGNQERIQEIDKEFAIEVTEAVDIPKDKEEMIGINMLIDINEIQQNKGRISEFIENGQKIGYKIQEPEQEDVIIKTKEELKQYLAERLQQIKGNEGEKAEWEKKANFYKINPKYKEAFKVMSDYIKEEKQENTIIEGQTRPIEESIRDEKENNTSNKEQEKTDKTQRNSNMWINRFQQWDSKTRHVSLQLKEKYTKMKSEIIKAIREANRTIQQENNNNSIDEGVYR